MERKVSLEVACKRIEIGEIRDIAFRRIRTFLSGCISAAETHSNVKPNLLSLIARKFMSVLEANV
jgi:hypothetical protein